MTWNIKFINTYDTRLSSIFCNTAWKWISTTSQNSAATYFRCGEMCWWFVLEILYFPSSENFFKIGKDLTKLYPKKWLFRPQITNNHNSMSDKLVNKYVSKYDYIIVDPKAIWARYICHICHSLCNGQQVRHFRWIHSNWVSTRWLSLLHTVWARRMLHAVIQGSLNDFTLKHYCEFIAVCLSAKCYTE